MTPLKFTLFDSYKKKLITLDPLKSVVKGTLKLYSCGPTVYNYQHIGNLDAAFLPDTIVNMAKIAGWKVEWVTNITDVGHLVSDGDEGEDKLEKGAKREGKSVQEIVEYYTKNFREQAKSLNLNLPEGSHNPRATEFIPSQMIIALKLMNLGRAYFTRDGIYYYSNWENFPQGADEISKRNVKKFATNKSVNSLEKTKSGREIVVNDDKQPGDFAIWKFVPENSLQKWRFNEFDETRVLILPLLQKQLLPLNSPNLPGCPGWHSECVAMITEILGNQRCSREILEISIARNKPTTEYEIDLHTGGEDHIPIHHFNEIQQSNALGFKLSKYWVHNKFILVDGQKMSKSLGNVYLISGNKETTGFYSLQDPPPKAKRLVEKQFKKKNFNPLAFRLLLLEHSYTEQVNFTWEKLISSQHRLYNFRKMAARINFFYLNQGRENTVLKPDKKQIYTLLQYLLENLNTAKFLEKFQEFLTKCFNEVLNNQKLNKKNFSALKFWDENFLKLDLFPVFSQELLELCRQRAEFKKKKDFVQADKIRKEIFDLGFVLDDYPEGFSIWKN